MIQNVESGFEYEKIVVDKNFKANKKKFKKTGSILCYIGIYYYMCVY